MESFVGHHELKQLSRDGIAVVAKAVGKGPHRKTLHQHLHADDLLVDRRALDDLDQKRLQRGATGYRPPPARLDVFRKGRDVTRLFARLVRGVFLRALVFQDMAERSGQVQGALLAMQDRGEIPKLHVVDKTDSLLRIGQLLGNIGKAQDRLLLFRHQGLVLQVERDVEVDIPLVEWIPEVVVRRADDLVERGRALLIAIEFDHRLEIVGRHGSIHRVFRDVAVGHGFCLRTIQLRVGMTTSSFS